MAAFPANSSTSAAKQTGAPVPILSEYLPVLKNLEIRPTGNCKPALIERETYLDEAVLPLALPGPLATVDIINCDIF